MAYSLTTNKTWSETKTELAECLRKWGSPQYELECDARIFGSYNKTPVKLRIVWKDGREIFWEYNLQERPVDNLRVLYLAADAMRLNEARGIDRLVAQAYGLLAAPKTERDPYEVLGLRPGASAALVDAAYKAKAKELHPDTGGENAEMVELNAARDRLKAEASI